MMLPEEVIRRAEMLEFYGIYHHPIYALDLRVMVEHFKATRNTLDKAPRTLTGKDWKLAMFERGLGGFTADDFPPCKECGRKLGHLPTCKLKLNATR